MSMRGAVSIVGAAETERLGKIPDQSAIELHAEAARRAIADAGLRLQDIDGVACAGESPVEVAEYLGITPHYLDGTHVGGSSFMLHVRHAAAAIAAGHCSTVLVTHGESGRSRVGMQPWAPAPQSMRGQFEVPYGVMGAPTTFPIGILRYMKEYGMTPEQLATVPVVQRQWAAMNPRAKLRDPITVEDVLASRVVAHPIHLLECCLVTDGGAAVVLTSSERAGVMDLPHDPVHLLGSGESSESAMISMMEDFTSSRAFRTAGERAFAEAGIRHADVDHLMIYDAFAHVPIYGLEDLGFVGKGEAPSFVEEGHTAPGGSLPLNTNGGGLAYTHTGMYGMFAIQESVRQLRGQAAAQVPDVNISVALGNGGMFMSAGVLVLGTPAALAA
ncbi:MAG TPA: thiolase [Nocardioides sp.]|uniref:thiolase C-terminal domain-containing protein n=1 Tax=Nocardioides sp. TaxID=35761 RepID=UPI002C622D7D|nr:thiolase [Nocardioides sp.]HTW15797.1 thiolase [Nocardioides sp.]